MRICKKLIWFLLALAACAPAEQLPKKEMLLSKPVYVYHRETKEVYVISQEDGTAEILLSADRLVNTFDVTPNGEIAYGAIDGDVYVVDGDTHTLLREGADGEVIYGIGWSPDMAWLAYSIDYYEPPHRSQQSHGAWIHHVESGKRIHLDTNFYGQYTDDDGVAQHAGFDDVGAIHVYHTPNWSPDSKTVAFSVRRWEWSSLTWFNLDDLEQPQKLFVDGIKPPMQPRNLQWTADNTQMLVSETVPGLISGAYLIGRSDAQITPLVDNVTEPFYMLWSVGIDRESGAYLAYGSTLNEDREYSKLTLYELEGENEVTPIMTHLIRCPEGSNPIVGNLRDAPFAEGIVWCGDEVYWLEEPAEPLIPLPELNDLLAQFKKHKYTIIVGQ